MLNFTDFLWSYKISVSVQIYRDCNLQRKCGHLTEILPTFLKSVNGSSFPVSFQEMFSNRRVFMFNKYFMFNLNIIVDMENSHLVIARTEL